MGTATIYLLGICILSVQGVVLKTEDAVIKRIVRSPGYCEICEDKAGQPLTPLPPPPPGIPPFPVFHTKQWSGLRRSHGGLDQGLFSGAAAGAAGGIQSGSQAFSLASTAIGAESVTPEQSSYKKDGKISDSFGQSPGGAGVFNGHTGVFGGLEKFSGGKGSFKESHFSYESEGDKQFASQKGLGFQADGGYGHHHFFTHGHHDHDGFGRNDQTKAGASSASSPLVGNGSNGRGVDFGSARHFENKNSGYRDQNAHYSALNSGSDYSAHDNGFEIYGNEQQKQQLQLGSQNGHVEGSGSGQGGPGYVHGSGSKWGGHFDNNGSKYASQNVHHSHFTSGYSAHGKDSEISGNEKQLQMGSLVAGSGSGQEGTGYEHGSGSKPAEHFESGVSKHGSQNAHHGDFTSGSGYNPHGTSGFSGNEQQQQQQKQKQLQVGSQNSYESGSGSGHEGFVSEAGSLSSQNGDSASNGYGSKQQEELQTDLSGALKLASEGLQQAQQQQGGCSTCDKSSYALSNAKSHSGSAIALSVAG